MSKSACFNACIDGVDTHVVLAECERVLTVIEPE